MFNFNYKLNYERISEIKGMERGNGNKNWEEKKVTPKLFLFVLDNFSLCSFCFLESSPQKKRTNLHRFAHGKLYILGRNRPFPRWYISALPFFALVCWWTVYAFCAFSFRLFKSLSIGCDFDANECNATVVVLSFLLRHNC